MGNAINYNSSNTHLKHNHSSAHSAASSSFGVTLNGNGSRYTNGSTFFVGGNIDGKFNEDFKDGRISSRMVTFFFVG
jgi:hypothetical protein